MDDQEMIKISVPWYLAVAGLRKWARDRALHAPEAWLPSICAATGLTKEQYRGVEQNLIKMLYGGIPKI
jgi:hypothetical protein